ncbi:sugar ABC transporter permease, partial [Agrobacterium sp. S2]|nr:sugar ABC transporter permease [Agrobacterium sp. S2]
AFVQATRSSWGLDIFRDVVGSSTFPVALRNTAIFVVVSLLFQYAIGLALAVFFRTSFRLSAVLRGLFLVPWLLPLIVSASTWSWMLNGDNGIVNSVLGAFGIGQINWLTDPSLAIWSVTIANIWLGIPFNLVILYSGLQNIPGDVYEAASLDGANAWQQFWRVTFPLLRPVSAITLLLGFIYTLKVVDVIWVMTSGGPANASTTLAVWSYR